MQQRSELDWLIYNDPLAYADLILNSEPQRYLKAVIEYKILGQDTNRKNVIFEYYKYFFKKLDSLQAIWYYVFRQEKSSQIQRQLF